MEEQIILPASKELMNFLGLTDIIVGERCQLEIQLAPLKVTLRRLSDPEDHDSFEEEEELNLASKTLESFLPTLQLLCQYYGRGREEGGKEAKDRFEFKLDTWKWSLLQD